MSLVDRVTSLLPVVWVYATRGATLVFRLSRSGEKNSTVRLVPTEEKSEDASMRLSLELCVQLNENSGRSATRSETCQSTPTADGYPIRTPTRPLACAVAVEDSVTKSHPANRIRA